MWRSITWYILMKMQENDFPDGEIAQLQIPQKYT